MKILQYKIVIAFFGQISAVPLSRNEVQGYPPHSFILIKIPSAPLAISFRFHLKGVEIFQHDYQPTAPADDVLATTK